MRSDDDGDDDDDDGIPMFRVFELWLCLLFWLVAGMGEVGRECKGRGRGIGTSTWDPGEIAGRQAGIDNDMEEVEKGMRREMDGDDLDSAPFFALRSKKCSLIRLSVRACER